MKLFFNSLYLNNRFFVAIGLNVFLFLLAFSFHWFFLIAKLSFLVTCLLVIIEIILLYGNHNGIMANRNMADRLSNGDQNDIFIHISNKYSFSVSIRVIDEVPFQFQYRDISFRFTIKSKSDKTITYQLRPVKRGEYGFGALNIYVSGNIGFAARRYKFDQNKIAAVYPSYLQLRKYELMAISNRLSELGIKKIRKIGHALEFEQIKEYVQGDDIRTINWKATARKNNLMINHYQEEKSQNVYSVIDKGRVMRMPFEKLSLLDYAINAALVISSIAIRKEDKAGIITFNHKIGSILPAGKVGSQMQKVQEVLYNQKTNYKESNFDLLYATLKQKINQRSLILLYTNFESLSGLERQLPYLQRISKNHVLVVIFFENTELNDLLKNESTNTEEIYVKTIAEKFAFEKKQIVKELKRHGIHAVLTAPKNLTVDTINAYLEIKARGLI